MYVKRGDYTHAMHEARFRWRVTPRYADNNLLIGTTYVANIGGMLTGTDAADLSAKFAALQAAYAKTTGNFVLLDNNGNETAFKIDGSKTIGGIRCTRCECPLDSPGDMTTYLNYEIDIQADAGGIGLIGGAGGNPDAPKDAVLTWTESITVRGTGGPRFVLRENRNGKPQKQIVSQFTPVTATQRGEAVGLYKYPTASKPVWPQHLLEPENEATRTSSSMSGSNKTQEREFRLTWHYQFWAAGPLTANPNSGF